MHDTPKGTLVLDRVTVELRTSAGNTEGRLADMLAA
jgi:hypothetical protein